MRNSNLRAGVIGAPLREIHVQPKELLARAYGIEVCLETI